MAAMHNPLALVRQVRASVTHTSADDGEPLYGPDSRVDVDYGYRHYGTAVEACLNLDQASPTASVDGDMLFDAEVPAGTRPQALKGRL